MSNPLAGLPQLPTLNFCVAVLASELPKTAGKADAPEWIKVTPRGRAATRDGRSFSFNPEALVARFNADKVDVPVDLDHGLALKAARGERVDSVGYATALEARADGTYARVNWLDGGKTVLAARTHRYVSPAFPHDTAGNATWLHSISLVAVPALPDMPALAAARPDGAGPATIAEALGLDAAADQAACLSAFGALRASFVPIGLFNDAVAALNVANATLAARDTAAHADKVEALLGSALKEKRIFPFQRAGYEALCVTDEGFQHVASLIGSMPMMLLASGMDGRHPNGTETDERPEALAARAARFRDEEATAGRRITQSEATRHVKDNPQAGR